jgi:hypothetical protein
MSDRQKVRRIREEMESGAAEKEKGKRSRDMTDMIRVGMTIFENLKYVFFYSTSQKSPNRETMFSYFVLLQNCKDHAV